MVKVLCAIGLLAGLASAQPGSPDWHARLSEAMPLLGHRNWILVVDSAYPLQTAPGIETIETNESHLDVVHAVLAAVNRSIQVRPLIYMDAELQFVSDEDAPGVAAYRSDVEKALSSYKIEELPHEKIISTIDEAGKTFHVLVLKTKMTIPYTSVFIRLDCKYWSADQEERLRRSMSEGRAK
jgi:D-ribose pyranose/furanose isomerase RbsD